MLYQLSYASSLGHTPLTGLISPSDPFQMSGTILKGITTALDVQAIRRRKWDPLAISLQMLSFGPPTRYRSLLSSSV